MKLSGLDVQPDDEAMDPIVERALYTSFGPSAGFCFAVSLWSSS